MARKGTLQEPVWLSKRKIERPIPVIVLIVESQVIYDETALNRTYIRSLILKFSQKSKKAIPPQESTKTSTYQLVDIGVNLTHKQFNNDLPDVLSRSINAGVSLLVLTGTTIRDSVNSQKLAATKPGVLFSTAGVHPHNAKECDSKTLDAIRNLVKTYPDQVKAVGGNHLLFISILII